MSSIAKDVSVVSDDLLDLEELESGWRRTLKPLIARLRRYDRARTRLEKEGGKVADLSSLESILTEPFGLGGRHGPVSVADPVGLRATLLVAAGPQVVLDVRRLPSGLPVHLLCRVRRDFFGEDGLVVEELHRGTGYPSVDARFVRLTVLGRESEWLYLAGFRDAVRKLVKGRGRTQAANIDRLLLTVGARVLSSAWHPDQRIGALVARHLAAPAFQDAIELAYLGLTADACELRAAASDDVLAFFASACPHPAIERYLRRLQGADGRTLEELPRRAIVAYAKLSAAFDRFLATRTTRWGAGGVVPLSRIVLSNWSRLELVGVGLLDDREVSAAVRRLEADSRAIVTELAA